jgi:hypothetical protein
MGTGPLDRLAGQMDDPDYDDIEFSYKKGRGNSKLDFCPTTPAGQPGKPERRNHQSRTGSLLGRQTIPAQHHLFSLGGMNTNQVASFLPTLTNSTPGSCHHFEKVSIESHPLVAGLHFSFKNDRLTYVNLIFHYSFLETSSRRSLSVH